MTRGTLALLLPDKVMYSTEFNGDMYPSSYGDFVFEGMDRIVRNELDFVSFVHFFNSVNRNYTDQLVFVETGEKNIAKTLNITE